jgi:predicted site-specific integrase-resolvase
VTTHHWFHAGELSVAARKVGWLILVDQPAGEAGRRGRHTAACGRVSWADQKAGCGRQMARVSAWATAHAAVDDDLVRDMSEILTSMCARLYGKRAAQNRVKRAPAAAANEDREAA